MTLIEAIKSGKRIRRSDTSWLEQGEIPFYIKLAAFSSIIADDWEVEPTPVTVTREQFNSAWDKAFSVDAGRKGSWLCRRCHQSQHTVRNIIYFFLQESATERSQ